MTDLQTLFAADPLSLNDTDFEALIAGFRASRHQFNLGNTKAGSTKPPTEKQKKVLDTAAKLGNFSLDL